MNPQDNSNKDFDPNSPKVVDESWQKMAICAIVIAAGCLIGVIVSVIIANSFNKEIANLKIEKSSSDNALSLIYSTLGVNDNGSAINQITSQDIVSGADMAKIDELLKNKYGAGYIIDFADATINNVYQGAYYKIVSLGVAQEGGTARALMYSKVADGEWKMASFDKTADDPCKDATDEDKAALQTIGLCELVFGLHPGFGGLAVVVLERTERVGHLLAIVGVDSVVVRSFRIG